MSHPQCWSWRLCSRRWTRWTPRSWMHFTWTPILAVHQPCCSANQWKGVYLWLHLWQDLTTPPSGWNSVIFMSLTLFNRVLPGTSLLPSSIVFIVMQWLSQSAAPLHSTCPNCLSQPYLITGLTGSNADNSMNSAFFFVKLLLLPAVASEEVSLYCYVKGKVKFIVLY